ncbi:uncharacterized protein LOC124404700 [Diprion similis]|uniref:uncharacterized protein LOC124404700 n=1 Tax=Diprion similis TaxID=362088 RepID=UPI001EF90ED5|nr:uncharacterized protein LOC124404700 [Diprion similis]
MVLIVTREPIIWCVIPFFIVEAQNQRPLLTKSLASPEKDPEMDNLSREIASRFIGQMQIESALGPDLFTPLSEAWSNIIRVGIITKRDGYQVDIQTQPGTGLCALGQVFSDLLRKEIDKDFDLDFTKLTTTLACPAVKYGFLYTKILERQKFLALDKFYSNYEAKMTLAPLLAADLNWWINNMNSTSSTIRDDYYELEIYSDASRSGWGAAWEKKKTRGWWNSVEKNYHINFLELKAAFYGSKCFAKDLKSCQILLRIDNTTAISYINKMGSIQFPNLSTLSREIWQWCEKKNIWIFASHISSSQNFIADKESRILSEETEWELADYAFRKTIFSNMTLTFPGSDQIIRKAFLLQDVPRSALDTTMASLSQATLKQYERPVSLWWKFCQDTQVSVFSPPRRSVLEFLTICTSNLGSYSSLNTYRSAVSLITMTNVGQDQFVKRFMKGFATQKPSRPKYNKTWDPSKVLDHISRFYPNSELSFEKLSKKLVVLLALITAQRVHTLSLIRVENIRFLEDEIRIEIPDRIKTSGMNRNQPRLIIPAFKEKLQLCPVQTLRDYLDRSKALSSPRDPFLIVITKAPYTHASSQTIRHWIKKVLNDSGIDRTFAAHSSRHASTSAAARQGLNMETIYRTAG